MTILFQVDAIIKMTKCPYLSPEASNPTNKCTVFYSNLKVEENKEPLVLSLGLWAEMWPFSHFLELAPIGCHHKNDLSQYRGLKSKKKALSLVFGLVATGQRYGHFLIFTEMKNWPYLFPI